MEDYLRFLEEEGKAPATIDCYRSDLRRLAEYLGCPLDEATVAEVRRYTRHELVARGLRSTTRARHCSVIRQYYKWAVATGLINPEAGLVEAVAVPAIERGEREVLHPDEIPRLLGRIREEGPRRDWEIAYSYLTTGGAGRPLNQEGNLLSRQSIWKAMRRHGVTPRLLTNTWRATRAERGHSQVQVLR